MADSLLQLQAMYIPWSESRDVKVVLLSDKYSTLLISSWRWLLCCYRIWIESEFRLLGRKSTRMRLPSLSTHRCVNYRKLSFREILFWTGFMSRWPYRNCAG